MRTLIFYITFLFSIMVAQAQTGPITGKVLDAQSRKPLDYVTVHLHKARVPVFTDEAGNFVIKRYNPSDTVTFALLGYKPITKPIADLSKNTIVLLTSQSYTIQEIVVRPKENPAYRIIRGAAKNKDLYLPENQPAIQFKTYTLLKGSILEHEAADRKKQFSKRYAPYLDSLALSRSSGRTASLPIFQSESVKKIFYNLSPRSSKEVLVANSVIGVGIEKESQVSQLLNAQAEHFSFSQNWLRMFDKDFVSPIANQWSSYYDYDLQDSVETTNGKIYKIKVFPKRPQDLAFEGTIWIANESFALRRIDLRLNKDVALNYVNKLHLLQAWDENNASLLPVSSKRRFELSGFPGSDVRLFVESETTYSDVVLGQPKPQAFFDVTHQVSDSAHQADPQFWQNVRPQEFTEAEEKRVKSIAKIKELPEIKSAVKMIRVVVEGHMPLNENFEWGPVFGAYVFNKVEGHRLQFGGRTTKEFHRNWIMNGYLAYGTKDKAVKSLFNLRYIADRELWTEWGASYLNDVGPAGMNLNNSQVSSLFFSTFRWGKMNFPYQQEQIQLWGEREWFPAFRQRVTFRRTHYQPVFDAAMLGSEARDDRYAGFTTADVTLGLRFSPDRKMLIRHHEKIAISNSNAPVFGLEMSAGLSGVMNSDLSYQNISLSVEQRVRAGLFGYGRYYLKAGKTFTRVPLPLLQVPIGNETPFFILEGYNLMPFFAFATDEFVSLRYDHHFEGAFSLTNRLPLLKKSKLIMVAGGAALYGRLTDKNQPSQTYGAADNFRSLQKKPYMEVNIGFKNIYQMFRADLVHRLTYKDLDAPLWGIKLSVSVNP